MQRLALRNTILIKKGERSFFAKHRNNSPPPPHFPQKKAINESNDNRIRNETPNIRTLTLEYLLFDSWVALFRSNMQKQRCEQLRTKKPNSLGTKCVNYLKDNFTTFCIVD